MGASHLPIKNLLRRPGRTAALVLDLLRDAAKKAGRAVLLVSHDGEAARIADNLYRMDGGAIKVEREAL